LALPALFCSSSYVASHCSVVVPQSGAKQIFYCSVCDVKLREHLKIWKNNCRSNARVIQVYFVLLFKGEKYV
jgi:hypothetical protein